MQNGTADTSNFDEEFTREQPTLTPVHTQLSSRDQSEFNGFSWVRSMPCHGHPRCSLQPSAGCELGGHMTAHVFLL